jgi:diketogulonate reductase-like aldo/keto reductase
VGAGLQLWAAAAQHHAAVFGLEPSTPFQRCAEHHIVVEAYPPFAHRLIVNHPEIGNVADSYRVSAPQLCIRYLLPKGAVVLQGDQDPAHPAKRGTRFEISRADMDVLDAMRDTEKHEDAMEFRWK